MWIATAEHCREIDRRSAEEFGVAVESLMERAGLAIFHALQEMLPEPGRVTFCCGKGNNGGDGFVAARFAQDQGYTCECLVAALESELAPMVRHRMQEARTAGANVMFSDDARYKRRVECMGCRDLIVDALLGTGATAEVRGPVKDAIHAINRSGVPVLAVDLPSGIHCDTGEELGESVWALRTVTFGQAKPFLFQGTGLEHAGYWSVAEIGIPEPLLHEPTQARLISVQWVADMLPERLRASHKGDNGHVLIVAGSERMPGAATMAAKAALRTGAGLVTVASTPEVCKLVASHLPECLFVPLASSGGIISADAADDLIDAQARCDAALFGPGLTHEPQIINLLGRVWSQWTKPCVVDADALNSVAEGVPLPNADCVLTPHPGEMSRLLHASIAEIQADRFRTVRQAIDQLGRCVLLKGPYSIVGMKSKPVVVNSTGNPGMATGGMGDVLGGLMAALLGQDLPAYYAASCAMYWHGMAADLCAANIGAIGYTATEVANTLPQARAKILASCDKDTFSCF